MFHLVQISSQQNGASMAPIDQRYSDIHPPKSAMSMCFWSSGIVNIDMDPSPKSTNHWNEAS